MVKADMQAMMLAQGGTGYQARHILPKLALARGLPMCSYSKETFEDGALLSYAPDQVEMCRRWLVMPTRSSRAQSRRTSCRAAHET